MTRFCISAFAITLAAHAHQALGQGVTVQLPTYRTFRVATTVSVPDRGGAYLGGVRSAHSSRQRFGSPVTRGGVAIGRSQQAAGMHVSATIHDHQQRDRELLSGSSKFEPLGSRYAQRRSTTSGSEPFMSVADIQATHRQREQAQQAEAEAFLQRAFDAAAAGKAGVARIHLQMAARRASGPLKERILTELRQLEIPTANFRGANKMGPRLQTAPR